MGYNFADWFRPDAVCALAADRLSPDTVWFILIQEECAANENTVDDYGVTIQNGAQYYKGNFLEKESKTKKELKFKRMKRTTFFYKESVVYFINFDFRKGFYVLSCEEFSDILTYVEHFGMSSL